MIAVTFQGDPAYLLDDLPDWSGGVDLDASLPIHTEPGITGRESRRALGATLRLTLGWLALVQGEALTTLRNSIQALNTQKVLCPLWPYMFEEGETPDVEAEYYVLFGDGEAAEIKTHAELPFDRPAFPMMVGRLASTPDPSLITDEDAHVSFRFVESDELALSTGLPDFTPDDGPLAANGAARPLFPFRPNWDRVPHSGASAVELERQDIGQTRQPAEAFYTQTARRSVEQSFTLTDLEAWQLLSLFQSLGATNQTIWIPAALAETRLTAAVGAADTALNVTLVTARGNNAHVLIDDLVNRAAVKVTGNSGNTWTLSAAVGTAFDAEQTRLESLALCRFATAQLSISFTDPLCATTTIQFRECPEELVTLDTPELVNTTLGALPTTAYLYLFTINYPSAPQTYKYTSFESDLGDYVSSHFEHDAIRETASLERQQVAIRSKHFGGNPLSMLIPFTLELPLLLEITECDVVSGAATNQRRLFSGEVIRARYDGPFITADAQSLSPLFERRIPRRILHPSCNWVLFETSCGLAKADWKWQGSVVTYNATTLELALTSVSRVSGGAVTLVQHYFAGGFVILGTGASTQYRLIGDSAAASGSNLTIVLASPLTTAPGIGETVFFHPGCDGSYTTCVNKFGNLIHFGGFPFMPVGNPSLVKVSKNVSSGGKK